jgi:hypothetical protein
VVRHAARALTRPGFVLLFLFFAAAGNALAADSFLEIRDRYFWDPSTGSYFIPHGVAYQIWNPPVGANQSTNQVEYDLIEFQKLRANSVRAELTWSQVQTGPNTFDWTRPDFLVRKAEELGLKLFVIIGYQYPPEWFPRAWRGVNSQGLRADVIQCLSNSSPAGALACLPPRLAQILQTHNSPAVLSQILDSFVAGAKEGGLSNILSRLEITLPPDQLSANLPNLISDVLNYEEPQGRAVYSNYIHAVTSRYRNSPAIAGWILGNEYAYFDLWEDPALYPVRRFLGYDALSQSRFRDYLRRAYGANLAALNATWDTAYTNFDSVVMPLDYPANRRSAAYFDLIQWRKQSIGDFVATGALAARHADPNHLLTYSMVGGSFNGRDANYSCEDARVIVSSCKAVGAPLDFWSINNYAWAFLGSEMRSASFGIGKYQAESGLPVMVSETGFSSTEDLFDYDPVSGYSYSGARQAVALPSTLLESLLAGAIGVHFFTWNDRQQFKPGYFYREQGFGIVSETRLPKNPVYANLAAFFQQVEGMRLDRLLGGSQEPAPEVQFLWTTNSDMVWPRANEENSMLWGALKRLGFQPRIIADADFEAGAFTNAPALLLSRCFQLSPKQLGSLASNVVPAGVHIHADADLPGQYDAHGRANSNWSSTMQGVFGVDTSLANTAIDNMVTNDCFSPIRLRGVARLDPISPGYLAEFGTWKLWRQVVGSPAQVVLTLSGYSSSWPGLNCPYLDTNNYPALLVHSHGFGQGRTAMNPFALGDLAMSTSPRPQLWDVRYKVLRSIYRSHFGMSPSIDLSGPGASRVSTSYRLCANGTVLIGLLNEDTNTAALTISAPALLAGRTVEDLSAGRILTRLSSGSLTCLAPGDQCTLLYAYPSAGGSDASLANSSPEKVWFQTAPNTVWPSANPWDIDVSYDAVTTNLSLSVALEQVQPYNRLIARSAPVSVNGVGTATLHLPVPDADPNDLFYLSSRTGARYAIRAVLARDGLPVSTTAVSVRLVFGVRPSQPLPASLAAGQAYPIEVAWEELPSYRFGGSVPLDRGRMWDSSAATLEHYGIVLKLQSGNSVVASNFFLTSIGTGTNRFLVSVPLGAVGPFTWTASAQVASNVASHNLLASFEGCERGAKWQGPGLPFLTNANFLAPWTSYVYPGDANLWQNEGVQLLASDGSQSAFIVATNPVSIPFAGLGMYYEFTNGGWALPADRKLWTNYVFSYDFQEKNGYSCSVEMQVKNSQARGGAWLQFTNLYNPGAVVWTNIKASLAEFLPPPGVPGTFDPNHVEALVANVRMLTRGVQYVASFDNIRFQAPETSLANGVTFSEYYSANDVLGSLGIDQGRVFWVGNGALEAAPELSGPWTNVPNAVSPVTIPFTAPRLFYRLRK